MNSLKQIILTGCCLFTIAYHLPLWAQDTQTAMLARFWQQTYGNERPLAPASQDELVVQLLAKAPVDQCFDGLGRPYPGGAPCQEGRPRINEAYLWSMAQTGQTLWLGTAANPLCGATNYYNTYSGYAAFPVLGGSSESRFHACEAMESTYPALYPAHGDWRPPGIYRYDVSSGALEQKTPLDDPLLHQTLGLRAAGAAKGVVLLFGPGMPQTPSERALNVFAFDADTGRYLGSDTIPGYESARQTLAVGDDLYLAATISFGGGAVLRWQGSRDDPFRFEAVAHLPTEAGNLALHENRIFVNTWPVLRSVEEVAPVTGKMAIYMSPVLGSAGLTEKDQNAWVKVWDPSDYDPDEGASWSYTGGPMVSYGGYLYWGTLNPPFSGVAGHLAKQGVQPLQIPQYLLGTYRPAHLFRGKNFATGNPEVEVLYGLPAMPAFQPFERLRIESPPVFGNIALRYTPGYWTIRPNKIGPPKHGLAGFGNPLNYYIWSMAVYQNQLFVGTMDGTHTIRRALSVPTRLLLVDNPFLRILGLYDPFNLGTPRMPLGRLLGYGADLYRFPSPNEGALPVSRSGLGNYGNFGIRTMLADESMLYIGTANPNNLMYEENNTAQTGGWELLGLEEK